MGKYILGIDVGTTGSKAMVIDLEGNVLGSGYGEYPCIYPQPNWVEQEVELLIQETFKACKQAINKSQVDSKEIIAVGFSSQRATFALVDEEENVIGNFYGWQDNRAASEIEYINSVIPANELYDIAGMPVTPTFSFEKIIWLMRNRRDLYDKAKYIVMMPDYVMHRFGVEGFVTERTNACCSGLVDVRSLEWSDRILDAYSIDKNKLPKLVDPGVVVGKVSADVAKLTGLTEGTPLCTGTGDQQCAALGAGVVKDGNASLTLGTAGLLVVGSKEPMLKDESGFLMVPSSGALGTYELEGIQLGAASSYRWARDILCGLEIELGKEADVDPFELMNYHINKSPVGANGVIFMPYLIGSGYPYWNPEAKGTFLGLSFSTNKSDMLRAIMEGITLESKDMYEAMKASNVQINTLSITGGATKSKIWRQIIADMFNVEVNVLKVSDATVVGAAILAGVGIGEFKDAEEGVERLVHFVDTVKPIPENVEKYNKSYEIYKKAYISLKNGDVFKGLSSL